MWPYTMQELDIINNGTGSRGEAHATVSTIR